MACCSCSHPESQLSSAFSGQQPLDSEDSKPLSSSPWARLKRFFGGDKLDRQRLKALGVGAVLSYGFVSNVTYGGGMAVSWIAFVKQVTVALRKAHWSYCKAIYCGVAAPSLFASVSVSTRSVSTCPDEVAGGDPGH